MFWSTPIDISNQCLEVCKTASEVTRQKIYRVGEAIADGDSDQVVVTTLADLFDVKKALSKGNSAQLVGSMTDESLRYLTEERYKSRFGAVAASSDRVKTDTANSFSNSEGSKSGIPTQINNGLPTPEVQTKRTKPSPNEIRKRTGDGQ